jgi:hypothetical protein
VQCLASFLFSIRWDIKDVNFDSIKKLPTIYHDELEELQLKVIRDEFGGGFEYHNFNESPLFKNLVGKDDWAKLKSFNFQSKYYIEDMWRMKI